MGTSSTHALGPAGSQSAYAASRLSAESYGAMGGPMYGGGGLLPPYAYTPSYPEQYQRHVSGNYGASRGRGNYRGMARGSAIHVSNPPGPPIVKAGSSKGPDGANLFIFHIPNDFTNQEMYDLFKEYGNVLSARIMVEADTGRSRGFGFVSYDSTESAALAIKELNGFSVRSNACSLP